MRCRLRDESKLPRLGGREYAMVIVLRPIALPLEFSRVEILWLNGGRIMLEFHACWRVEEGGLVG